MTPGSTDLAASSVDLFVVHYDACSCSRQCFKILHDRRCLSVQFMLDVDGTIYQTLDLRERAWHAAKANTRSVGVEIANFGARSTRDADGLAALDALPAGRARAVRGVPRLDEAHRRPDPASAPAPPSERSGIEGPMQGGSWAQYDYTAEQYASLARLNAALCEVLPRIEPEAPRDDSGGSWTGSRATRPTRPSRASWGITTSRPRPRPSLRLGGAPGFGPSRLDGEGSGALRPEGAALRAHLAPRARSGDQRHHEQQDEQGHESGHTRSERRSRPGALSRTPLVLLWESAEVSLDRLEGMAGLGRVDADPPSPPPALRAPRPPPGARRPLARDGTELTLPAGGHGRPASRWRACPRRPCGLRGPCRAGPWPASRGR